MQNDPGALFFKYDCQNLSYINRLKIPGKGAIGNPLLTLPIWRAYVSSFEVEKVQEVVTDSFFSQVRSGAPLIVEEMVP